MGGHAYLKGQEITIIIIINNIIIISLESMAGNLFFLKFFGIFLL